MKPYKSKYLIFFSLLFSILSSTVFGQNVVATNEHQSPKYALFIAITKYSHRSMNGTPSLKYPQTDAIGIGNIFKNAGYEVVLLQGQEATQRRIVAELKKASGQGVDGGAVAIGLFGHGVQYGPSAYLCPVDAKLREVKDTAGDVVRENQQVKLEPDPDSLISLQSVLDTLKKCGATNRILLADCCRNDPSAARGRAFGSNLESSSLPEGTAAFFACKAGQQAFEHDDWNGGAFSRSFIDVVSAIRKDKRAVTAGVLGDQMYETVERLTQEKNIAKRQSLHCISNGRVEFLFEKRGQTLPSLPTDDGGEIYSLSFDGLEPGDHPKGWKGSQAITADFSLGIPSITKPNDTSQKAPYSITNESIPISGDFSLEFETIVLSKDAFRLTLLGDGTADLTIDLMASTYLDFSLADKKMERKYYNYGELNYFYLSRKGSSYKLVFNNQEESAVVFDSKSYENFRGIKLEFGRATKSIKLTSLRAENLTSHRAQRNTADLALGAGNLNERVLPAGWKRLGLISPNGVQRVVSPNLKIGGDFEISTNFRFHKRTAMNLVLLGDNGPSLPVQLSASTRIGVKFGHLSKSIQYNYGQEYSIRIVRKNGKIKYWFNNDPAHVLTLDASQFGGFRGIQMDFGADKTQVIANVPSVMGL